MPVRRSTADTHDFTTANTSDRAARTDRERCTMWPTLCDTDDDEEEVECSRPEGDHGSGDAILPDVAAVATADLSPESAEGAPVGTLWLNAETRARADLEKLAEGACLRAALCCISLRARHDPGWRGRLAWSDLERECKSPFAHALPWRTAAAPSALIGVFWKTLARALRVQHRVECCAAADGIWVLGPVGTREPPSAGVLAGALGECIAAEASARPRLDLARALGRRTAASHPGPVLDWLGSRASSQSDDAELAALFGELLTASPATGTYREMLLLCARAGRWTGAGVDPPSPGEPCEEGASSTAE